MKQTTYTTTKQRERGIARDAGELRLGIVRRLRDTQNLLDEIGLR
jgi:hypothetical protein